MKKELFVYYLKDVYALRFCVEKIRMAEPGCEISFLVRKEVVDKIRPYYPEAGFFTFRERGRGKLGKALAVFDFRLIAKARAYKAQKTIFLFHTNFGLVAFLSRCFLFILGVPENEFSDMTGKSYAIRRRRLIIDAISNQFPKAVFYYWLSRLSLMLGLERSLGKPVSLTIEPLNICNIQCPICRTGMNKSPREKGIMSLEAFKTVIDKFGDHTNNILLYGFGEPFLNKDIYDMIRYAKKKDIYVSICTNGMSLDQKNLIDSGLDSISFAIGGLTQETHEIYRRGSRLEKVLENMKGLIELKRNSKKENPKVILDFVVQKQNEGQLDEVLDLALDIGADGVYFIPTIIWSTEQADEFLPVKETDFIRYDEKLLERGLLKQKSSRRKKCDLIWFSFIIQWNEVVSPCCGLELPMTKNSNDKSTDSNLGWDYCADYYPLGNILNGKHVSSLWNGEKFKNLRRRVLKNIEDVSICRLCSGYDIPNLR